MVLPLASGDALVGTTLGGRYHVVQHLGSGGMGHVYLAEGSERGGDRRVAVKVLRAEHRRSPALVARFEREALAAARVRHPHVLEVFDVAMGDAEELFFAMELLVGLDLADTLAFAQRLIPARALRVATSLAAALGAAHAAGVIHRDVKPENVFLVHEADGREVVKLLDFGFASIEGDEARAARHTVVGTPEYLAPEQAMGDRAAPSADVYALGIVLFEMLAGRVPFVGANYPAIARMHIEVEPPSIRRVCPSAAVSAQLEGVVRTALAKEPEGRFGSMEAFAAALGAVPEAEG